jgi:hypothetical protein
VPHENEAISEAVSPPAESSVGYGRHALDHRLMVAAPLDLTVGGPLIELAGRTGGLALSGGLTLLVLPIAALAVLRRAPVSVTLSRRVPS